MRCVLFVLLLAAATPAAAAMDECQELTSNVEMTECAWNQYRDADTALNDVWGRVMTQIEATDADVMPADKVKAWRKVLTAAQRDWANFKDQDCNGAVAFEWYGGSGAGLAIATCLYDHTVARTKELTDRYFNN
jgi:uncharacterized protein YecT (DUF1311 family)